MLSPPSESPTTPQPAPDALGPAPRPPSPPEPVASAVLFRSAGASRELELLPHPPLSGVSENHFRSCKGVKKREEAPRSAHRRACGCPRREKPPAHLPGRNGPEPLPAARERRGPVRAAAEQPMTTRRRAAAPTRPTSPPRAWGTARFASELPPPHGRRPLPAPRPGEGRHPPAPTPGAHARRGPPPRPPAIAAAATRDV